MRIHLLSDLHNEIGYRYQPAMVDADVIVLAGDIDVKSRGVTWAHETFAQPVLYVPGNHEYYGGHLGKTLLSMLNLAEQTDGHVTVMDCNVVVIGNTRFLGATSWTDYSATGSEPMATLEAHGGLNDYQRIRCSPGYKKVHPRDLKMRNHQTRVWLRAQLAIPFEGKTVVITHHAPSMESLQGNPDAGGHLDAAYANKWEDFFPEVDLWLHGHSHFSVDYQTPEGCRVVANPKGYAKEGDPWFNPQLVIEV